MQHERSERALQIMVLNTIAETEAAIFRLIDPQWGKRQSFLVAIMADLVNDEHAVDSAARIGGRSKTKLGLQGSGAQGRAGGKSLHQKSRTGRLKEIRKLKCATK